MGGTYDYKSDALDDPMINQWHVTVFGMATEAGWDLGCFFACVLTAGLTAAGFGAGSALTVIPIQNMIKVSGFQATFFNFGLGQGIIICLLAFFMFAPKPGQVPVVGSISAVIQSRRQFAPREVIGPNRLWIIAMIFAPPMTC